ncbi:MAG: DUF721 domain-containing protein [Muribaculaceae bacterium]|nr:DUF721 domain-containing protein [Muribaculaceae bacterium]
MQRYTPQSVGDVLRDLLEQTSMQNRLDELKAADMWIQVAGSSIAQLTGKPSVKNGVMYIGVPNASLRNELHMNRSRLREIINKNIGKEVITEIKFTS